MNSGVCWLFQADQTYIYIYTHHFFIIQNQKHVFMADHSTWQFLGAAGFWMLNENHVLCGAYRGKAAYMSNLIN